MDERVYVIEPNQPTNNQPTIEAKIDPDFRHMMKVYSHLQGCDYGDSDAQLEQKNGQQVKVQDIGRSKNLGTEQNENSSFMRYFEEDKGHTQVKL